VIRVSEECTNEVYAEGSTSATNMKSRILIRLSNLSESDVESGSAGSPYPADFVRQPRSCS
jgi:hypothetical protein